jgi:predicted TIM-barrel fold metal-dependent hydrolase
MTIDGYCTLGVDREYDLTTDLLLSHLDAAAVERAVIAPPDRALAVDNRTGNDAMLAAAAAHPERLIPACTANPWYGEAAANEVVRAAAAGARLLVLHPQVQGVAANDELVLPVVDAVPALPVYVHTGPPGVASPWQVAELALLRPHTDFIIGHCGATDFWNDVPVAAAAAGNLYIESSLARPFSFKTHLDTIGRGKGIMGSAAPLTALPFEWTEMERLFPRAEWPDVYGGTLRGLLEKERAL